MTQSGSQMMRYADPSRVHGFGSLINLVTETWRSLIESGRI